MRQIDDVIGNRIWPSNVNYRRWRNQQGARAGRRQPGWDDNGRNMDNNPDGGNFYENDYYDERNTDDYRDNGDRYHRVRRNYYDTNGGERGY